MLLLSLITGLGIGTFAPVNLSIIITAGMIMSISVPVMGPTLSMIVLGMGVATTAKNIIQTAFTKKASTCNKEMKNMDAIQKREHKKKIAKRAAKEAKKEIKKFAKCTSIYSIPLYVINIVKMLGTSLLSVSALAILMKTVMLVKDDKKKLRNYSIAAFVILAIALFTITSGTASGVFIYFLTLIAIPSSLKKEELEIEEDNTTSGTTKPLEAFLYGQGGTGTIITAIVMLQTILWGSGKDAIGTVVNSGASMLIDPARIGATVIVVLFLYLFKKFRAEKEIEKVEKEYLKENKDKKKKLLNLIINSISLIFALIAANPLVVISLTLIGLILNAFVDSKVIRAMSVPALLIFGSLS